MNDKFINISSKDLFNSLLIYVGEHANLLKDQKNTAGCRKLINEIIKELKNRKQHNTSLVPETFANE